VPGVPGSACPSNLAMSIVEKLRRQSQSRMT
jgi:hypothetical protein